MSYSRRSSDYTSGILLAIGLICVAILIGGCVAVKQQSSIVRFKVDGKESVSTNDGHEYRVYTDDDTYKVGDSLLRGNFRSSQTYGRLQIGHSYECKAIGIRVPILSWFKNIQECKEIQSVA